MFQSDSVFPNVSTRGDERNALRAQMSARTAPAVDRWVDDQLFEEDVRAVLLMMRPNRRERLMGWSEYRTGGKDFRATISWNEQAMQESGELNPACGHAPHDGSHDASHNAPRNSTSCNPDGDSTDPEAAPDGTNDLFTVPNVVDVLEAILIGSIKADSELSPEQECEAYRRVLKAVERRVGQFQECYA